jgi:hypothetical protein
MQNTNILIINQSTIDFMAAIMMILTSLLPVNGTGMNRDSVYDQFICRIWLTNFPLWSLLISSTYSILVLSLERYVAIIHPVFYKVIMSARTLFYSFHFDKSTRANSYCDVLHAARRHVVSLGYYYRFLLARTRTTRQHY